MPAPIGRLLQGRGKHGVLEILQRRAMMLAPARLALGAVQGTVEVAKPYGAARRCMQLLDWHDFAVQGTVKDAVLTKKTCVLQCSTTMLAPARLARLRGAMHRGGGQTLRCSATMQHLQDWHDSAV